MKGTKIKHLLASALLILPLALQVFTGAAAVHAGTGDTTGATAYIRLHKLQFTGKDLPTLPGSDDLLGKELDTDQLQGGKALGGVEFTAYDVTGQYNALSGSAEDRQKQLSGVGAKDVETSFADAKAFADKGTKVATATTTADQGTADFALPEKTSTGDNAVYMLLETKSQSTPNASGVSVTQVAAPIVLIMPLSLSSSKDNPLHMYPKDVTEAAIYKNIDAGFDSMKDNAGDTAAAIQLGQSAHYTATVTVPSDIANLDQFVITDLPEVGLNDVTSTVKVTVEGNDLVVPDGATAVTPKPKDATSDHGLGFTLTYKGTDLAAYKGKTLTIKYDATLNKDLISGQIVNNKIDVNGTPTTSVTPVTTGGAKFQKVASDTKKGLPDAQFIVLNSDGTKFLTETGKGTNNAKYSFVDLPSDFKLGEGYDSKKLLPTDAATASSSSDDVATASSSSDAAAKVEPVVLTSDSDGNFEVSGLGFGAYQVAEIKAPDGYAVLGKATDFIVDAGSYNDKNELKSISDSPKGLLPSTGGMGIYIVIAAGLALVALGFAFLRRGKHHEEV